MNKHLYRVIFNKARGLLVVVAEIARAHGKGSGNDSHGKVRQLRQDQSIFFALPILPIAIGFTLGSILFTVNPAHAEIIADKSVPKNQQATVLNTANGHLLVNIQTPSAAGVSRNAYSALNVPKEGAIFNNSRTNVQTQLGGWVQGNPSLAAGSARIILNEVNSSSPSLLQGYMEVAGQRAQMVVVNPSGISCDGCGFINTSRGTLTTGSPILSGGALQGYRVQNGVITIQGKGLDASQTDYTDIIARSVQINAGVWANDLKLITGTNRIDVSNSSINPITAINPAPTFSIDVASLGGMYAGKIHLIGTEMGVGVRNGGAISTSAAELQLTADGYLINSGTIAGTSHTTINTRRITNTSGRITAGQQLTISSDILTGDGELLSGGDANITLGSDYTHTSTAKLQANGNLSLTTSGTITNQASILADKNLTLNASNINNTLNAKIVAKTTILNTDNTLINRGLIDGKNTFIDTTTLNNIGTGKIFGDHLAIAANRLTNEAETVNGVSTAAVIAARNQLDFGVDTLVNNGGALLFSAGNMTIGGILDSNHFASGRSTLVTNTSATIEALGDLTINADTLINERTSFTTERILSTELPEGLELLAYDPALYFFWGIEETNPVNWRNYVRDFYIGNIDRMLSGQLDAVYRNELNALVNAQPLSIYQDSIKIWNLLLNKINNDRPQWISTMAQTLSGQSFALKSYDQQCRDSECDYITYVTHARTDYKDIVTSTAPSATILAGGNADLLIGDLINKYSTIEVGGNLNIIGDSLLNEGAELYLQSDILTTGYTRHWVRSPKYPFSHASSQSRLLETVPAIISAGKLLTGSFTAQIDNVTISQNTTPTTVTGNTLQSGTPITTVPSSSLFQILPSTTTNYLIETNPQFANYRNWLSSDYMLEQLNLDPATIQKRLGDGFYEQRLIREQIAQLTGRRFLDGYVDDEAQYRALLNQGVTFANAYQLIPGVTLTEVQIAQLTSDIVWLVERDISLADGTIVKALVPQVYVRLQHGDLLKNGSLIMADTLQLDLTEDLNNSGTIAGRSMVSLTADNLNNIGGRIHAGDAMTIETQGDITIASTLQTLHLSQQADFNRPNANVDLSQINRIAGLYVDNPNGVLVASAGHDLNLLAGEIMNKGINGQTLLESHNNMTIGTLTETNNSFATIGRNWTSDKHSHDVGSLIQTKGEITVTAGHDFIARAANVSSLESALKVTSGNNITIKAGQSEQHRQAYNKSSKKSAFSSKTTTRFDTLDKTTALTSTFDGETVDMTAGNTLTISGSNVVGTQDVNLEAQGDINLVTAKQSRQETHYKKTKKSGLMSSGGIGFTIGSQQQSVDTNGQQINHLASTIGSVEGDVNIKAGKIYSQKGSDVLAPVGDVNITAQQVDIIAAEDTANNQQTTKFKQSGLTLTLTSPIVSAIQTAQQMSKASEQTENTRMKALAAGTSALAASNAYDAVIAGQGGKGVDAQGKATSSDANMADQVGGINISISVGSSKSESTTTQSSSTVVSSAVIAGGDINIAATGAQQDSDINIIGSTISAGENISIIADDEINFKAAQNTASLNSDNESSSASVGIGFSLGGASNGFTLNLGVSGGRGDANGDDIVHTNSVITAGNIVHTQSGSDTNLKGASIEGEQVIMDVGTNGQGNLKIESLQDVHTYESEQDSFGVGLSLCIPPFCYGTSTANVSASSSDVDANYASVIEQSGIKAGDGGFQVNVAGNTDLKGAVIASSKTAVKNNKNSLTTQTITVSDIENKAEYDAESMSASIGTNIQAGEAMLSGAGIGSDSGDESSTTVSGISDGNITITDETKQQAITGTDAALTVASVNRDVTVNESGEVVDSQGNSTAHSIAPIFDAEKVAQEIQAQTTITQAFSQQASSAVAQYTHSKRSELQSQLKQSKSEEDTALIEAQLAELFLEEKIMNVLIGAVTGFGGAAVTKESLSLAADKMRQITIENSKIFAGITDGDTTISNSTKDSEGLRGDRFGTGGTRIDLDVFCGTSNERCKKQIDVNGGEILINGQTQLLLNNKGQVQYDPDENNNISLAEFLETDQGKKAAGITGGIQGWQGTLFGIPYLPGSWQEKLIESFGGTHDVIGGQLSGLYDEQGNATRGRSDLLKVAHDRWSEIAIPITVPFAMSESLPPEVWHAISIILKAAR